MGNSDRKRKIIWSAAGAFILALGLAVVIFYIYKRCRAEFNADFTDTLLWANASVESGKFYNPDYWYAYFLPFSGIPLMIPIVAAFGLTYFSHQLGMTIFVLIFAAVLVWFFRSAKCSYGCAFALSGITLILMCSSVITRMIFYGHIIHYSLVIVFMCVAFCLLSRSSSFDGDLRAGDGASQQTGKKAARSRVFICLTAIWCLLCTTNGVATILLFFVPFVASLILERYLDKTPISLEHDKGLITDTGIISAGGLIGVIIKFVFFSSSTYEDSITALLPSDGWVWKQSPFLLEWIKVLTGDSPDDVLMQSFDGIRILVMYVFALILLIVPVFAAISYKKITNRLLRLFILYYWLMFAITLLTYSVSYALVSNWRLAHLACASLMVTLLYTVYMLKNRLYVRWIVLLIPVLAVCTLISMLTVRSIPSATDANQNDRLIAIFEEHGLTRGYSSSFWNSANAATVLSDGKIVVSPITIYPDGSYEVRRYQSEPWEYEDAQDTDRYFVVVADEDLDYAADTLGKNKIEEIKYQDNMYIWVFDRNIFENLEPVYTPLSK